MDFKSLLTGDIGALSAALFNGSIEKSMFVVTSEYKSSKYVPDSVPLNYPQTADALSNELGVVFRTTGGSKIQASYVISRGATLESLQGQLFDALVSKLSSEPWSSETDAKIAFGIWGLRGSWDGKGLYAVDVKKDEPAQIDRWRIIVRKFTRIPYKDPNIRRPEDPKQHQVRVNVDWLISAVGPTIKRVNNYKYMVLQNR